MITPDYKKIEYTIKKKQDIAPFCSRLHLGKCENHPDEICQNICLN